MKWYLGRLMFRIVCGDGKHTPQFDEQFRLILALDEYQAMEKALVLGREEETTFMNTSMQTVLWKFEGVTEVTAMHELKDGMELFSRITEEEDGERFSISIRQRADVLVKQLGQLQAC